MPTKKPDAVYTIQNCTSRSRKTATKTQRSAVKPTKKTQKTRLKASAAVAQKTRAPSIGGTSGPPKAAAHTGLDVSAPIPSAKAGEIVETATAAAAKTTPTKITAPKNGAIDAVKRGAKPKAVYQAGQLNAEERAHGGGQEVRPAIDVPPKAPGPTKRKLTKDAAERPVSPQMSTMTKKRRLVADLQPRRRMPPVPTPMSAVVVTHRLQLAVQPPDRQEDVCADQMSHQGRKQRQQAAAAAAAGADAPRSGRLSAQSPLPDEMNFDDDDHEVPPAKPTGEQGTWTNKGLAAKKRQCRREQLQETTERLQQIGDFETTRIVPCTMWNHAEAKDINAVWNHAETKEAEVIDILKAMFLQSPTKQLFMMQQLEIDQLLANGARRLFEHHAMVQRSTNQQPKYNQLYKQSSNELDQLAMKHARQLQALQQRQVDQLTKYQQRRKQLAWGSSTAGKKEEGTATMMF